MKKLLAVFFSLVVTLTVSLTLHQSQAVAAFSKCKGPRADMYLCSRQLQATNQFLRESQSVEREIIDKMGTDATTTDDVEQNVDSEGRIEPDTNVFFFRPGFFVRNAPSPQEVQCRNEKLVCCDKIPDSYNGDNGYEEDCEYTYQSCLRQAAE